MAIAINWFNEPHPGATETVAKEENVTRVQDLILKGFRVNVREIAKTADSSKAVGIYCIMQFWA